MIQRHLKFSKLYGGSERMIAMIQRHLKFSKLYGGSERMIAMVWLPWQRQK